MRKIIFLSFVTTFVLSAQETSTLETINVVEKSNSKLVKNISQEQLKNADLAEALSKVPNISIVRRSGIANDIILRGQKKDNINVLIDDAKIYGACPNRMDASISHVLTNNIENVRIIEGPYDVENFGTLSGLVKVETKEPQEGVNGEINLNAGSFDYRKASATISGGNDFVKALVSASTEKGGQYKDGNGNDFLKQQIKSKVPYMNQYKKGTLDAFEKQTVLTKLQFNLTDDQDLKLSYTANRSDEILYPAGPMDADYDDSDVYTLGYTIRELGDFSKELNIDYYYSKVEHPMSNKYRNSGQNSYNTNHLKTSVWGTTVKNSLEVADSLVTFGLDTSVRNWRGGMYSTNRVTGAKMPLSNNYMYSTDTTNKAIFSKVEKTLGSLDLEVGLRYDYTHIDTQKPNENKNKYIGLSGYIFGTYNIDDDSKIFGGVGKSSRVPDARELYLSTTANSDLEQTQNYEVDLGFDKTIGAFNIKPKIFYSKLKNYIYNSGTFENIDTKIYGLDVSGFYYMTENFYFDYGVAYQKGRKDGNYDDKDLAEIPPLKANLALNYEYKKGRYSAEIIAVDRWDSFDESAKEQELGGYALVNLKYSQELFKHFDLTLGVDNLFDKTYNSTNTYQDITYIEAGGERVLFNDPGRYGYINLRYSF